MSGQIGPKSKFNLLPIDLKTAGSIIYRLTQSQNQKAVRVHLDGLHKSKVSFREITTTLKGIFGKITEKDVLARSVTSGTDSVAPSPDGWYFIIVPKGVPLIGRTFREEIKRQKITVRRVHLETFLKSMLDGKALMFSERVQGINPHSERLKESSKNSSKIVSKKKQPSKKKKDLNQLHKKIQERFLQLKNMATI